MSCLVIFRYRICKNDIQRRLGFVGHYRWHIWTYQWQSGQCCSSQFLTAQVQTPGRSQYQKYLLSRPVRWGALWENQPPDKTLAPKIYVFDIYDWHYFTNNLNPKSLSLIIERWEKRMTLRMRYPAEQVSTRRLDRLVLLPPQVCRPRYVTLVHSARLPWRNALAAQGPADITARTHAHAHHVVVGVGTEQVIVHHLHKTCAAAAAAADYQRRGRLRQLEHRAKSHVTRGWMTFVYLV